MTAKPGTYTAMGTDNGHVGLVKMDSTGQAGTGTGHARITQVLIQYYAAAVAWCECTCGACPCARWVDT